jgi:hypothetical protein
MARHTMNRPHRLGSWICPSGNSCDADLVPVRAGVAMLTMGWDTPPPLRPEDEQYYRAVIRPAVVRLVQEYEERLGGAVVVDL